jgi:UDP-glucose 4-epimerase
MGNKSYLVTGAAGFIGSALAGKLVNAGHSVVTIDNLSTGFRENIPEKVDLIEGDCSDKETIGQLDKYQFDTIFHIAGQSSGEISFEDPIYDLQTNAQSTLLLLKYALKTNCKKFIYASTMSVYGDQPDEPVKESAETNPLSFYAVGKIASEHYIRLFTDFGMTNTALRLFNVYGPGQNMKNLKQGMVSIFLAQAINSKKIVVKGSPDRYRDFVFIDDIVRAFIQAEVFDDSKYRVLNIGTGTRTTIAELLEKIVSNLPHEVEVEFSDSTLGDQFGIYSDISKAMEEMNWKPKIEIDEGIKIFSIDAIEPFNQLDDNLL